VSKHGLLSFGGSVWEKKGAFRGNILFSFICLHHQRCRIFNWGNPNVQFSYVRNCFFFLDEKRRPRVRWIFVLIAFIHMDKRRRLSHDVPSTVRGDLVFRIENLFIC